MKIFISYRRIDSPYVAGQIRERLVDKYGNDSVFFDVDSISAGEDFRQRLEDAMKETDVLLVVIGDRWLDAKDDEGNRCLDNEDDWVRSEIEVAMYLEIPIIPLLVRGVSMPKKKELPDSMKKLVDYQAMPIRIEPDFNYDMNRLLKTISNLSRKKRKKSRLINKIQKTTPPSPPQSEPEKAIKAPTSNFTSPTQTTKPQMRIKTRKGNIIFMTIAVVTFLAFALSISFSLDWWVGTIIVATGVVLINIVFRLWDNL